ncbi:Gfo/Idh/MocA family protein [Campylobacter canadensis]|uniref:Gfo/Idh/MocA family oxidoreductase n=1 Tax=Campylobacter canadensis TaxID=449520 RepID=A0ABS7WQQ6_9BACT|nr:Gfo/Idh/MocA family oxidoreductase [Campylobacter canadensis]MBZ7986667.1 Gfo/Idh/MocA family oxidoreductase [Campylobacter canadensis]MBZ7993928.1 Gfo/Idh/MocA family oxidoreductase [Campylobacter canadensis]MBZ7996244.1 Gfo/Idh/MocA family oxidoreductase [Campylobacter canadensis]MBZ7997703.1 Gfo/Idh/MocA family oxidoreductase [Campylobacter canadensis]MBZ7999261.1 Gfo/Idh/MocA family oxidoreductase [Campylobacter canadensis]
MKLAIIGLGVMGKNHYTELKKENINLYCFDIVKADFLSKDDNFYLDLDELIKNDLDAAIIATPTKFHFDIFVKIHKKVKNILIEKPLSFNLEQAYKIKELAKNNNVCVGFCERFNPVSLAFKELLKENEEILYAKFIRASSYPARISDVGVDMDLSVHDIDLANFFGIKSTFEISKNYKNNLCSSIKLNSNKLDILASWEFNCKIRRAFINTNLASYELDFLNSKLFKNNEEIKITLSSSLKQEHKAFINLIKTNNMGFLANIDDAIYTQELLS